MIEELKEVCKNMASRLEKTVFLAITGHIPEGSELDETCMWAVKRSGGYWNEVLFWIGGECYLVSAQEIIVGMVRALNDLRGLSQYNQFTEYPKRIHYPDWWLDAQKPPEGW